ncbi:MAG: AAA family ATPase [Oscillospiraceae bacterium]
MGKIIFVASGKGGVGKSSFCASLGFSFASMNKKVLLIDLDLGLRSLDFMLGTQTPPIYNLADILNERCEIAKAIIPLDDKYLLNLISAPIDSDEVINFDNFKPLFEKLTKHYDFIIIDCGAGMQQIFKKSVIFADEVIIVTNPDCVSVRDASVVSSYIYNLKINDIKLIINKVNLNFKQNALTDFDKIIDEIETPLLGVIPNDFNLSRLITTGSLNQLGEKSFYNITINNIAQRLLGKNIPLLIN